MVRMPKKSLLRSKIEEAVAARVDKDAEDDDGDLTRARVTGSSDEDEGENNVDFAKEKSRLRTRNAPSLADLDPRYRGKKSSRKSLNEERGCLDAKEHDGADLGYMFEAGDTSDEKEGVESAEESYDDEGEEDDEGSEEELSGDGEEEEDVRQMSQANIANEIKKGLAIKNQLSIWESLMECRIQLQKVLTKVNRYPQHDTWKQFKAKGDEQYALGLKKTQRSVTGVLDELLEFQHSLINRDETLRKVLKRGSGTGGSDNDMDSGEEDLLPPGKKMKIADYSVKLVEIHSAMKPWRNETIEKWNDKTRISSGSKSFSGFETSVLRQIEHILSDRSRLVARTQTKRSTYRVLGSRPEAAGASDQQLEEVARDPEVFDDDDFYHQLLRELIDRKSADVTDPTQLGKHWLQIQKMRSKLKRRSTVDTKASKGRKTRFDIHAKLVNFMAPASYCVWKDDAKNELFSSLFGSMAK